LDNPAVTTSPSSVSADHVGRPSLVHLLTFDVGGRRFALRAELLREVVRAVAIAPLPKAPPIVEGVINVRGAITPTLDIRRRFGLPPTPVAPDQHLLIAEAGGRVVALRVDQAVAFMSVEAAAIASAAEVAPGAEYVAGVAKLPDGLMVIHDLDRFLSLEEAGQVDAAMDGTTTPGRPARRTDPS